MFLILTSISRDSDKASELVAFDISANVIKRVSCMNEYLVTLNRFHIDVILQKVNDIT